MSNSIFSFDFIYPYLVIMERLGEQLASWLYQSRRELKLLYLKHGSLTTNRLSIFLLLLFCITPLTLYFLISGATYSILQISASYIFVALLFSLSILLVITWFKSEKLFKSNVQGFSFLQLSPSLIETGFFGFDKSDIDNLIRLTNVQKTGIVYHLQRIKVIIVERVKVNHLRRTKVNH
ncbi:hypothetical protein [Cellulophaga sp. Hel_I_12]|uniref:hypothetical protein n=1 Tax=Cellulophaga sp. Hel_I_12 TaxID=1249972 RepID=UPI0006477690|nr:hypothetical protein [Cellulophaga sp. Hel_I_12]